MGDLKFGSSPSGHARVGRCPGACSAMPRRHSQRDAQRAFNEYKHYRKMNPLPQPEVSPEPSTSSSSRRANPNRPFDELIMVRWSVCITGLLDHHVVLMKAAFHQAVSDKYDRLESKKVDLDALD